MPTFAQPLHRAQSMHLASPARPGPTQPAHSENSLLAQQQSLGNQALQRRLRARVIQAKLRIGQPGDIYEQEADRVAEQVMRMSDPSITETAAVTRQAQGPHIQRLCTECEEKLRRHPMKQEELRRQPLVAEEGKEAPLQAKPLARQITPLVQRQVEPEEEEKEGLIIGELSSGPNGIRRSCKATQAEQEPVARSAASSDARFVSDESERRVEALRRGGRPLSLTERGFMEPRFGVRFDTVRVHTDPEAAQLARELNARAFTCGNDIAFAAGEFQTNTVSGRTLLAHELTHVVQQVPGTARMIYRQEAEGAAPISRAEEIRLSRTSPGRAVAQSTPAALSLFNFGIDRHRPKEFHVAVLREFASFVREEIPFPTRIRVVGHASSPGRSAHNEALSRSRAEAIAAILGSAGLGNVNILASGESAPVTSNDTVEGRTRNRRVDLLLSPAPQPGPTPQPEDEEDEEVEEDEVDDDNEVEDDDEVEDDEEVEDEEEDFCDRFPILCDLVPPIPIPIPIPLPLPWPLICVIAPELCVLAPCIINPALCIPGPPDPPEPPERPERPEEPEERPTVIFGPVRASNTPAAMGDRIPDQGSTNIPVTVTGLQPSMGPILIRRVGAGTTNGDFRINGTRETTITGSTVLGISGVTQTSPAAAGFNLQLEAALGPSAIARSATFAVSAIMENMSTSKAEVEDVPAGISLGTMMSKESDGANDLRSLDEMGYSEELGVPSETGGMVGFGAGEPFRDALAQIDQIDWHITPRRFLQSEGRQDLIQVHTFVDFRTGSMNIPVTNSGFNITRLVEPDPERVGCLRFVVSKSGMAGTASGITSGAGSGSAEDTFQLPCPRGGGGGTTPGPRSGGGRGGGSTPSTSTLPTPHLGAIPPGTVPFGFVALRGPRSVSTGLPFGLQVLVISFSVLSTDPSRHERRFFTSPIPCRVTGVTSTHVVLTTSPVPLSLAPADFALTVMPALKEIRVPLELLR